AHPGVVVDVQAFSEEMDVQLHRDGRGLDVEAVVSVSARVKEHQDAVVFVRGDALPAGVEADVEEVAVEHVGGRGAAHLSVEGTLSVAADVPLVRVIDVSASARASAELAPVPAAAEAGDAARGREVLVSGTVDYRALCVDENGDLATVEWREQ